MDEGCTRRGEDDKVVPSPQDENKRREWIYIFERKPDFVCLRGRGCRSLLLLASFEIRCGRTLS